MSTLIDVFYKQIAGFGTKDCMIVYNDQTIQDVLNLISDTNDANKKLILVPPGHELEYFQWKPNVEVKFLDNLDERWQLDKLEGWDNLDEWEIGDGFTAEVVVDNDVKKLKLTGTGSGSCYIELQRSLDLRKYQGLLFNYEFDVSQQGSAPSPFIQIFFDDENFIGGRTWSGEGVGSYSRKVFLSFSSDYFDLNYLNLDSVDWENIKVRIRFNNISEGTVVYLSDFCLVRTTPYPALHINLLMTSKPDFAMPFIQELLKYKIIPSLAIVASRIRLLTSNNTNHFSVYELQQLYKSGVKIVSLTTNYPYLYGLDERATRFEVESSNMIFSRMGVASAQKWWRFPHGSTNPYFENLVEPGYVISSKVGVPIDNELKTDELVNQVQVLKKGGIYFISVVSSDLETEEQMQNTLTDILSLREYFRFVDLDFIQKMMEGAIYYQDNEQSNPLYFYEGSGEEDERITISFYHKGVFVDPNGRNIYLDLNYVGLKPGDRIFVVNTGTDGKVIFDATGVNVEVPPRGSYEFVYY